MNVQPETTLKKASAPDLIVSDSDGKTSLTKRASGASPSAPALIDGGRAITGAGAGAILALARKAPILWASFILGVLVPSLSVVLYLAFIASDQYVAEARLSVRTAPMAPGNGSFSTLGGLGPGSMQQLAGQDAHIVAEYLRSRAAVEDLSLRLDLGTIFRRPGLDFWARLKLAPKAEDLQKYWAQMMRASVDGPSGIVTISVRAFRPEDAKALAEACVQLSEALVNKISERARFDALRKAEEEARRAEGLLQAALRDLRAFRDKEGILDPGSAANSNAQLLLGAMAERGRLQTDMFVLSRALAPDAPTVKALKDRIDGMDSQIEQLRGELTNKSPQAKTLSSALGRFEELEVQRIFAEKLFTIAQGGLERARSRAQQQQLYLTVFARPYLPQEARYPERLAMSLVIPMILLMIWSIFALTGLAIEDHLL